MRITQLPTGTQASTDYIAVDNTSNGTRKIPVGEITATINTPTYANGILDYAVNVAPLGVTVVSPRNMGSSDLPGANYIYGIAVIAKRTADVMSVTIICDNNYPTISNARPNASGWNGWRVDSGMYVSSVDAWNTLLKAITTNRPVMFDLGTTPTSSIFGLSGNASGMVEAASATSSKGSFVCAGKHYDFEYNQTSGALISLNRYSSELFFDEGSSKTSSAFTIANSTRGIFQAFSTTAGLNGQFHFYSTTTGSVVIPSGAKVGCADFTLTTATNKITAAHASARVMYRVVVVSGSVSMD